MSCGVRLKRSLPSNRPCDIGFRHLVFLRQRVAEDREIPPVKEVQNPVVHSTLSNPQLIDAVSQDVRKRPPQFVPKVSKPRNSRNATLVCALVGAAKLLEPVENRNVISVFLVEDDVGLRLIPYLYTITILLCLPAQGSAEDYAPSLSSSTSSHSPRPHRLGHGGNSCCSVKRCGVLQTLHQYMPVTGTIAPGR